MGNVSFTQNTHGDLTVWEGLKVQARTNRVAFSLTIQIVIEIIIIFYFAIKHFIDSNISIRCKILWTIPIINANAHLTSYCLFRYI